jgi:hypothetical protein
MKTYSPFLCALVLIATVALGCGTNHSTTALCGLNVSSGPNQSGSLQSVTVCPATADAKNYTSGLVPFTAIGFYDTQPSPVAPLKGFWGACSQQTPTNDVTISSSGVAQCAAGATGTYSVFAAEPGVCDAITACGGGCQITGYAQLSCP